MMTVLYLEIQITKDLQLLQIIILLRLLLLQVVFFWRAHLKNTICGFSYYVKIQINAFTKMSLYLR